MKTIKPSLLFFFILLSVCVKAQENYVGKYMYTVNGYSSTYTQEKKYTDAGNPYFERVYSESSMKYNGLTLAYFYFDSNEKCISNVYAYSDTKFLDDVVSKFNRQTYALKKVADKFRWINDNEHYYVEIQVSYPDNQFIVRYKPL